MWCWHQIDWPNNGTEWRIWKLHTHTHTYTHIDFWQKGKGGFPSGGSSKEPACQCRTRALNHWIRKISWRRKWQPTSVFLSGKILWIEELGGLQSLGPLRVEHNWATEHTYMPKAIQWGSIVFWHMVLEQLDIHNGKKKMNSNQYAKNSLK